MAIETIYVTIQATIYTLIIYSMIGYEWKVGKFFFFFYFMWMSFIYFTLSGMMIVALTPSYRIGAILLYFFFSLWNVFSGFLIPRVVSDYELKFCMIILKS